MFNVIISFPPIKEGKDAEFQKWFYSSNQAYSGFKGFVNRKLLRSINESTYAAIVEMNNKDEFEKMHRSKIHNKLGEEVRPLFNGKPTPRFYEVVQE